MIGKTSVTGLSEECGPLLKVGSLMIGVIVLLSLTLLASLSLSASPVSAQGQDNVSENMVFSLDSDTFYFKTGQDALISLHVDNSYGRDVGGVLTYSVTQTIDQGSFRYSSSNSQSTTFSAKDGSNSYGLDFGTSDSPMTMDVSLTFNYDIDNSSRTVAISGVKIIFVSDDSRLNSSQASKKISSSSQERSSASSGSSGSSNPSQNFQDPFAQQQQRMQEMMNRMFGNQQQNPSTGKSSGQSNPSTQQKLQNNQLSQDSSALKRQIGEQLKEQQALKEEFQKNLAKNKDFQKAHRELLDQGYNVSGVNMNPQDADSGDFEVDYKRSDGSSASLKGHLQDGKMSHLQKDTPEIRKDVLDRLMSDEEFKRLQSQLISEGFNQSSVEFDADGLDQNETVVKVNYLNNNNESASIKAQIDPVNKTVEKVELVRDEIKDDDNSATPDPRKIFLWSFLVLLLVIAGLYYYLHHRKEESKPSQPSKPVKRQKPFDHVKESNRLLRRAEKLFKEKRYKDSYEAVSQAIRLYLSYEHGLNREMTNDDLIGHFKRKGLSYKDLKGSLDICSLVEFAKYAPNKKDFATIMDFARSIIPKEKTKEKM